jgi:hypothetical protein
LLMAGQEAGHHPGEGLEVLGRQVS